jgi:hypothetical protein
VDFPATLESIENYAFYKCESLTAITFAEGYVLKTIGNNAFEETGLTSVDFPATLESIGEFAFSSCTSLTNVTFNGSTCYGPDVTVASKCLRRLVCGGRSVVHKPVNKKGLD